MTLHASLGANLSDIFAKQKNVIFQDLTVSYLATQAFCSSILRKPLITLRKGIRIMFFLS